MIRMSPPKRDDVWSNVGQPSGVLVDQDIILLGSRGLLISKEFEQSQVKQSCYELRVGKIAYFLSRPESERKKVIDAENPLIIRPQEVVTIITFEEVDLPDFVLGRIISKGHLFSIGLSPVITYADPGFAGNLGITFINLSKRTIKFNLKDAICKIEFEKLGKPVQHPYRGQHNFASEIWPIDANKFVPKRKIEKKDVVDNELLKSEAEYFGEPFDLVYERMKHITHQIQLLKFLFAATLSLLGGIALFLTVQRVLDIWRVLSDSMQTGIVSAIISGLFALLAIILEWRLLARKKDK
jgi:dCTP deaminase